MELTGQVVIDYGVALLPAPGEVEAGDGFLVQERSNGVLVAVIDGLGHGPEAAAAKRAAIATLETSTRDTITGLLQCYHRNLLITRGAVISIAYLDFHEGTMVWLGVGNVAGVLFRSGPEEDQTQTILVNRNGVIGQNLPVLHPVTLPINKGDTLVFATDGVREEFVHGTAVFTSPNRLAEQILNDYLVENDDALVLVVRYLGATGEP